MTKTAEKSDPAKSITALIRDLVLGFTKDHGKLQVQGADVGRVIIAVKGTVDDHPRLVGSKGKNITALQAIAAAAGRKAGKVVSLTLLDPLPGTPSALVEFATDPKWRPGPMIALLKRTLDAILGPYQVDHVKVSDLSNMTVTPEAGVQELGEDLGRAVHTLFHAIGKTQGREVHVLPGNGTRGS